MPARWLTRTLKMPSGAAAATPTVYAWLPPHPFVSVAVTVMVFVPAPVGLPLMTPLVRPKPAGKLPLVRAKVYEPAPPLALRNIMKAEEREISS